MNIALISLIIGFLYGTYDLFLKLSAGKIQPNLGAVLCQTFSALFALSIFLFLRQTGKFKFSGNFDYYCRSNLYWFGFNPNPDTIG